MMHLKLLLLLQLVALGTSQWARPTGGGTLDNSPPADDPADDPVDDRADIPADDRADIPTDDPEDDGTRAGDGSGSGSSSSGTPAQGGERGGDYKETPPVCFNNIPKCYEIVREDRRRCAAPRCGGYYIRTKGSNYRTKCPDGSFGQECYVSKLDTSMCFPIYERGTPITKDTKAPPEVGGERPVPEAGPTEVCGWYAQDERGGAGTYSKLMVQQKQCVDLNRDSSDTLQCYKTRRDRRRCAAPRCGGYWLSKLISGQKMTCPGSGEEKDECYVSGLDNSCLRDTKYRFVPGDGPEVVCGSFSKESERFAGQDYQTFLLREEVA